MEPLLYPRLRRVYYGALWVAEYLGLRGGEGTYRCTCACGQDVVRTESQLNVHRLQACDRCRADYVNEVLEYKAYERAKERRHADHFAALP